MNKGKRIRIVLFAAVFVLAAAAGVIAVRFSGGTITGSEAFTGCALVLIGIMPFLLAAGLKQSVSKTLYSYSNAGYIGGILFFTVLFITAFSRIPSLIRSGAVLDYRTLFSLITDFPGRFAVFAVPVMTVICLALGISNIALIRHEGFRPTNLLSVFLAAFYIGGTAAIYMVSDFIEKSIPSPHPLFTVICSYITMFLLIMMCYFECILIGCGIMGYAASRHIPSYDKDFIIILGCSIDKKGGLLPLLKGRANRAVRFAWSQEIATGKRCLFVPSGGQGPDEIMSEGSAMEFYLLSHGAETDEVFPEKKSRNTYENMVFSKKLIDSLKPGARIAFATTNYHVYRSGILAREAGIDAEGIASNTKWYFWPNGFVREFIAILAMNKRAHIIFAAAAAFVCAVLGAASYFALI